MQLALQSQQAHLLRNIRMSEEYLAYAGFASLACFAGVVYALYACLLRQPAEPHIEEVIVITVVNPVHQPHTEERVSFKPVQSMHKNIAH